jgi:alkyl hydroperoxide reductase subunit AhpF
VEQDGTVHTAVTAESLVAAWRHDDAPKRASYDVVIIGGGPAGLGAAVYARTVSRRSSSNATFRAGRPLTPR